MKATISRMIPKSGSQHMLAFDNALHTRGTQLTLSTCWIASNPQCPLVLAISTSSTWGHHWFKHGSNELVIT